jgi:hypothetical protein
MVSEPLSWRTLMADDATDAKVSYPYMTAGQWFGIRSKLRQSAPKAIDVDWVMSALGTSEKGARNIMPQLRAVGLIAADGAPSELALDLRDDETYSEAAKRVLESLYPQSLRDAYNDPETEFSKVASWFMRNAKTGETTANMQAKLYLTLLKGELPGPDDVKQTVARKPKTDGAGAATPRVKVDRRVKADSEKGASGSVGTEGHGDARGAGGDQGKGFGPNLHLDLQIHISADAGADQIDAVFKSMAKYLYDR